MFNIGLKKEMKLSWRRFALKRKRSVGSVELMNTQVRKILEQKGQGLILMVRG